MFQSHRLSDLPPFVPVRFRSEQHLRRQTEIRAVREQGRRLDCRAFTVWWKPRETGVVPTPANAAPKLPRVCVIASTSAVGHAVLRNRAKRRLREVFRQQQASVPAGCDMLLIARPAAITWPLAELKAKFAEACGRIGSGATAEKR